MFEFWLAAAVLLIILEVTLGFTIVLLFSSLACFSVAALVYLNFLGEAEIINQFAIFFMATTVWAILLWKPFKTMLKKVIPNSDVNHIIGHEAIVTESPLKVGHVGLVKWSGTLVRAKLDESSIYHEIDIEKQVVITNIIDNIFIVKEIN